MEQRDWAIRPVEMTDEELQEIQGKLEAYIENQQQAKQEVNKQENPKRKTPVREVRRKGEKRCPTCEEWKALKYFGKDKGKIDGLTTYCKACTSERRKKEYPKRKQQQQEYYRENRWAYLVREVNKRGEIKVDGDELQRYFKEEHGYGEKFNCLYCNREITDKDHHIDHIMPVSAGGDNYFSNLVPTCRYCNRSKWDEDFSYWYTQQFFYDEEVHAKVGCLMERMFEEMGQPNAEKCNTGKGLS